MNHTVTSLLMLATVLATACSEAPVPSSPSPAAAVTPDIAPGTRPVPVEAEPSPPSIAALPFVAQLARGQPYAEARAAILGAGWRPIVTDACAENVGGEAAICRDLPELEACSGTGEGFCLMAFGSTEARQALTLRTVGGHEGWATIGEAATMRLDHADLVVADPAADRVCGANDFPTFLETFAGDPAVRAAWTAPLVRVVLRYDLGEDSVAVAALQRAEEFRGFPVIHQGEAFHHVDANGAVDLEPLALRITEPDPDTRDVAFDYGMSEGNRVRFARSGDCWELVEDPDPPSP